MREATNGERHGGDWEERLKLQARGWEATNNVEFGSSSYYFPRNSLFFLFTFSMYIISILHRYILDLHSENLLCGC